MRYTVKEHLRDNFWPVDFVSTVVESTTPKLRKFFNNLLEVNYEEYLFRIIENLPYAFFIIFLGIFAILTLVRYTERPNGIRVTTITTNSMYPKIEPGSIIITSPEEKYKVGDIITYKEIHATTGLTTGRTITHRIIEKKMGSEESFVTKGDSNEFPDPGEVKKSQVLGEVFLIIPFFGYLDVIIRTIPGFIIFILVPSLLLIRNEIKYLREEKLLVRNYRSVT